MTFNDRTRLINYYFLLCYLITLAVCSAYLQNTDFHNLRAALFSTTVFLTYGIIYLLPAYVITRLAHYTSGRIFPGGDSGRFPSMTTYIVAVASTGGTVVLLYVDRTIYSMLGFHINGFVLNLITTPGGIESMGASKSAGITFGLIVGGLFGMLAFFLWILGRFAAGGRLPGTPRKAGLYLAVIFFALTGGERVTYGVSHLQAYSPVLKTAYSYPLYLPFTFRGLAGKLGFEVARKNPVSLDIQSASALRYPLHPLTVKAPAKPLNIVWLVGESLRWDMLDPEIMPDTFAFSREGRRFTQHYSGGIGTRMGMFSMFYGLYGSYWFSFLAERKSPVLMDELQRQGYRLSMYTSAAFSYPEFDKTIFAGIPAEMLHPHNEKSSWKSDQKNITEMLAFLKNRDTSKPFMTFMFFESPHARYYFPEESILRKDYLQDFNYATMSLEKDIGLIFNRYVNSCHHLDSQIKRVLDFLQQERLLDNTMVIITGDHGEEFMEKGHWGHNSYFVEEQARVPLVIYAPGVKPEVVDRMTSHLDIVPTVMHLLGVENPPEDFCLGFDLLGDRQREYTVLADWNQICLVEDKFKAVYKGPLLGNIITTRNDQPVTDETAFTSEIRNRQSGIAEELRKFNKTQNSL